MEEEGGTGATFSADVVVGVLLRMVLPFRRRRPREREEEEERRNVNDPRNLLSNRYLTFYHYYYLWCDFITLKLDVDADINKRSII